MLVHASPDSVSAVVLQSEDQALLSDRADDSGVGPVADRHGFVDVFTDAEPWVVVPGDRELGAVRFLLGGVVVEPSRRGDPQPHDHYAEPWV